LIARGSESYVFSKYAASLEYKFGKTRFEKVPRVWCSWYSLYKWINEPILLKVLNGLGDLPFDVFQIDDGWQDESGHWEAGRNFPSGMAAFADKIKATGRAAVVLGAARDAALAADVAESSAAATLAGRDRPELLPALFAELDALVCGDTGVAHLAAALGTPVAALFGPTDPGLTAPRGPVSVIRHAVPCAPCFYRTCPIEHPCMREITAETVWREVDALLARTV